jgi:hypothetical protein
MKTTIVFLSLLSVVFGGHVFTRSDRKSTMYSISDAPLSWIDAMKVNSNPISAVIAKIPFVCGCIQIKK